MRHVQVCAARKVRRAGEVAAAEERYTGEGSARRQHTAALRRQHEAVTKGSYADSQRWRQQRRAMLRAYSRSPVVRQISAAARGHGRCWRGAEAGRAKCGARIQRKPASPKMSEHDACPVYVYAGQIQAHMSCCCHERFGSRMLTPVPKL